MLSFLPSHCFACELLQHFDINIDHSIYRFCLGEFIAKINIIIEI